LLIAQLIKLTGVCLVNEVRQYDDEGKYFICVQMRNDGNYFGLNREFATPLLSIGQMIELLQDSKTNWTLNENSWNDPNICAKLWEAYPSFIISSIKEISPC
jgi:hypothetical protein